MGGPGSGRKPEIGSKQKLRAKGKGRIATQVRSMKNFPKEKQARKELHSRSGRINYRGKRMF
jgi:hypothetical protein